MRYFFDTEFMEDGDTIDLISIGIVAEDGRELYVQSLSCDLSRANDWVRAHVVPHLENYAYYEHSRYLCSDRCDRPSSLPWLERGSIARIVKKFTGKDPEFWAYYGAYDWVVLNQLYGPLVNHPDGWPFYCCDLRQLLDEQDKCELKQPEDAPHHALMDARWIAETWRHVGDV